MQKRLTDTQKLPECISGNLAILPTPSPGLDPFRRLISTWLDSCKANGLADKTIFDYREKNFKFWWWWKEYTHYYEKLGTHPKFVTRKEAREFVVYLQEPNPLRWGQAKDSPANRKTTLSAASISNYGRTIRVFFNWLATEVISRSALFPIGFLLILKNLTDDFSGGLQYGQENFSRIRGQISPTPAQAYLCYPNGIDWNYLLPYDW